MIPTPGSVLTGLVATKATATGLALGLAAGGVLTLAVHAGLAMTKSDRKEERAK